MPNFTSTASHLLAQLNSSDTGWDPAPISSLSNTFTMDSGLLPSGGEGWDIGDGVWLNTSGITNFSNAADPDYPHISALLADGINESLAFQEWTPVGGGGGVTAFESVWFNRHPDFVGFQIDFIRLNEHDLSLTPWQGGTQIYENHTWEIWGHRLFVAFYLATYFVARFVSEAAGAFLNQWVALVSVCAATFGTIAIFEHGAWDLGFFVPPRLATLELLLGCGFAILLIGAADGLVLLTTRLHHVAGNGCEAQRCPYSGGPAILH